MRALSLMAAGVARIIEIPEPRLQAGDLLLRVERVGLCGTDLNSFRGRNPLVTYPRVLGHEIGATVLEGNGEIAAGTLVTVSPYSSCGECSSCRRGRPNACQYNQTFGVQRDGAITERLAVPAAKVYPASLVEASLTVDELCLVEPLTVGFHACARGRVSAVDTVAVFGCGGVGLGAIAGAAFRGARTIAVDLENAKLETALKAGASEVIHSARENVAARLAELTRGHGPDVMIEAIGLPETFRLCIEAVAFTGRVVYIGYAKEPVAYETRLFVQKELDVLGSRNALPEDFLDVMRMLAQGSFPVAEAITARVPLDEGPAVLASWSANPAAFTKILIQI